jgi:hypothetical protein
MQYAVMAEYIWILTAVSVVPQKSDLEMLFDPLKEEFYQPSFLIEICDIQCGKMLCIRQESELTVIFLVIVADESE